MKSIFIIIITLLSLNTLSAQKYTEYYIKEANKVGLEFWNQVNNGEYEQSYSKLSDLLKNRFPIENWKSQMSILMLEFGKLKNRTIINTYFQSELKGFEDGFYVVIEYDVKYSKTRNHSENLLLKQNDKLDWEIFDFDYVFQDLEDTE